ncbi:MAG: TonB-dependent receptor [Bacteroidota bacterium]|nr:TonB-dependent receptor [Bacteroidota bacterium]
MKNAKEIFFLLFVCVLAVVIKLQAQDTANAKYTLAPVDITQPARIYSANPGLVIEKPDSIQSSRFQSGTVTDLLGQNGMLFLKSYGGGNLATTTIRGASASQTPVMWNGINLQSPTNGNVDLSLLPVILCDYVSIQNGGGSAGWGSGAIGGVIQTGNAVEFGKGYRVHYAGLAGSFGQIENGIKLGYSNQRFSTNVRAYRQTAENNFTYRNLAVNGFPKDTIMNSDFLQEGIYGEVAARSKSDQHHLYVRGWYQNSKRGIPPTMLESAGTTRQKDEFFRGVIDFRIAKEKYFLQFKSVVFTEFMDFYPGYNQPTSLTHSAVFINEADFIYKFNRKISVSAGANYTFSKADVTQFVPVTKQDRVSVFAGINYLAFENLDFALNLRDELVMGKRTPLVGSFGVEWWKYKFLTLRASVSRNYRIPTFNDLYWVPGGNPDLQPEDSWNEDVSADVHFERKKIKFSYIVTVYNRNTENWILWQPGPGYWSPVNLLSVWSRGVEHRLKIKWTKNKADITFLGGYDYVRATNEKSKAVNDVSVGKQLMYLPANHFFGMIQFTYRKFYLAYNHQYNDLRFTATDHTSYLPAFDIASLTIGQRVNMKNSYFDIFFRVNNLFDKKYQAIAWRPMPGRNFQLGITIDFNSPLKNRTE